MTNNNQQETTMMTTVVWGRRKAVWGRRKAVWGRRTVVAMVLALTTATSALAQPPQPVEKKQSRNLALGLVGVITMVAGGALMVPWPMGEDWELLGDNYCYSTGYRKIDLERGTCDTMEPMIKAGLITAGIGAALAVIGFSRVTVRPAISKTGYGATATVQWGK
jgi:hypothetical protein